MSTDFREFKWKTLAQNYEDFQNELDNAANGIDFLKDLFLEFQKFEARSTKDKLHRFYRVRTVSLNYSFQSASNNHLLSFIDGMDKKFQGYACLKTPANAGTITQIYRNSMSLFTRYAQVSL